MPQSPPLQGAGDSDFDRSDVAANVHPDLVAQITEQVMERLAQSGLGGQGTPGASQAPPQASTGAAAKTIPTRDVYTPPSPERYESLSTSSGISDVREHQLDGYVDKDPRKARFEDRPSTPPSPEVTKRDENQTRPKPPPRISTDDATTLEKIWQRLFDPDDNPTPRLGQFLRGLAIHLIDDYVPCQSLVVTPDKMLKFYEDVKLPDEIYPWHSIFGGKLSNSSLSHLYRDLACQHHFVQVKPDDKPSIPGLTPHGFECWMTHVIRAHPDVEYRRFSKAVLDMPISNADDNKERFPKQLSRRLFPARANTKVQADLEYAISYDPVIILTRTASNPVPPSATSPTSPTTSVPASGMSYVKPPPPPSSAPRERKTRFDMSTSEDTVGKNSAPPIALERERKPYTAQPGGGRVPHYDDARHTRQESHVRANTFGASPRPIIDQFNDHSTRRDQRTGTHAGRQYSRRKQRSLSPDGRSDVYNRGESEATAGVYASSTAATYSDSDDDGHTHAQDDWSRRYAPEDGFRNHMPPPRAYEFRDEYDLRREGPKAKYATYPYPPPPRYN